MSETNKKHMKEVTKYQSDSGAVFDTKEKALKADLLFALFKLAENNGTYHVSQNSDDVAEFIIKNFAEIEKIIKQK